MADPIPSGFRIIRICGMPALTRKRSDDAHREVWHVYFGDVQVGTTGERAGVPVDHDWRCGLYPGFAPGEHRDGTAPDFFTARRQFETAWRELSAEKTEATTRNGETRATGPRANIRCGHGAEKLPSQIPSSMMRCVCSARFDSHEPAESYDRRKYIYAAQLKGRRG